MKENMTKILITGASGLLGHNACRYFLGQGYQVIGSVNVHDIGIDGVESINVDVTDPQKFDAMIVDKKPDVILHCIALTNVDVCEKDVKKAENYHIQMSSMIAKSCEKNGIKFIYITTDQLWSGDKSFVEENEPVSPVNVYGKTKALSESAVLDANPSALIIRTNFYGIGRPWRLSFTDWIEKELEEKNSIKGIHDIFYTPIFMDDLLETIGILINKDVQGIIHVVGSERISKYDFMIRYAELFGHDKNLIESVKSDYFDHTAKRPKDMSLSVEKVENIIGRPMPTIDEGLNKLKKQKGA